MTMMKSPPLFQPTSLSVTELTRYLRNLLDSDEVLRDVWVQGEISNLSRPSSGHLYFTLKDSAAALKCVIWRSTALRIRIGLQNGLAVEAHGAISIYERDGQYQLYVDTVRLAGEGLLYQEFLRLKNRLETEGLFDPERKRSIPERPARIGIVTSPTGAALQDMLNTLRARYPLAEVFISPCAVQGDAAPGEIVRALELLNQVILPDVILVARGGGSLEDLWAFNDERVVRAIAASPIPVITGIGHETDFTLADFAADFRAPTPTGAAMQATPDRADLLTELYRIQGRLNTAALAWFSTRQQELDALRMRFDRETPSRRILSDQQSIDDLQMRSLRAARHAVELQRVRLQGLKQRLEALNPAAILNRGYALVQDAQGKIVRSVAEIHTGDVLGVSLHDGSLHARVENIEPQPGFPSSSKQGA